MNKKKSKGLNKKWLFEKYFKLLLSGNNVNVNTRKILKMII
jgi:hypothetical protein